MQCYKKSSPASNKTIAYGDGNKTVTINYNTNHKTITYLGWKCKDAKHNECWGKESFYEALNTIYICTCECHDLFP